MVDYAKTVKHSSVPPSGFEMGTVIGIHAGKRRPTPHAGLNLSGIA